MEVLEEASQSYNVASENAPRFVPRLWVMIVASLTLCQTWGPPTPHASWGAEGGRLSSDSDTRHVRENQALRGQIMVRAGKERADSPGPGVPRHLRVAWDLLGGWGWGQRSEVATLPPPPLGLFCPKRSGRFAKGSCRSKVARDWCQSALWAVGSQGARLDTGNRPRAALVYCGGGGYPHAPYSSPGLTRTGWVWEALIRRKLTGWLIWSDGTREGTTPRIPGSEVDGCAIY